MAMLYGFSINILPIFMVITQWYQMRLNPMQVGPEMSEAQRINAKMMRFMPFMFLIFLYFFSSALVLYWTVQNLMTILQTLLTKNVQVPEKLAEDEKHTKEKGFIRHKSGRKEEILEIENDVEEEEKKFRNLLGLKARGRIDLVLLENRYNERMNNYSAKRLASMSEQKRIVAEGKRDKLTEAYEFIKKCIDEES